MSQFRNPTESHKHSVEILSLLNQYDSFLDGLTTIADMGCGAGLDAKWWATLETRDEPAEPRNFIVYAVDQDISKIDSDVLSTPNVVPVEGNFEDRILPRKIDLIWAHDSFQYARDPLTCLASWKNTLALNGMLVLSIPQTTYIDHRTNKLVITNHSHQYYSYNLLNLIYMLAMSGFDCRDAYFYREDSSPWLYAAVYASEHAPIDQHASWYDLAQRKLISDSLIQSVDKYGYARLEDVTVAWLDRDFYRISN